MMMTTTKMVQKLLPNLEVHAAGYTSIDVTKPGIYKAYGLYEMEKHLKDGASRSTRRKRLNKNYL